MSVFLLGAIPFAVSNLKYNSNLNAAGLKFEYAKNFKLKKDEKAYVYVTEKGTARREVFIFSWTLYDGLNLVINSKFRKYPRQIMLSLRPALRLYKQSLLPPVRIATAQKEEVMIYLDFEAFERGKATINAYVWDKSNRVDVEFKPDSGEY